MKEFLTTSIVLFVLSLIFEALFPKNTEAIPAFSRKYKSSCVLCHAPFPRLTSFGNTFRLNGYKFPEGDELYIKDEPVSLGAEAYKKVFPEAIWPSDIPGMPPISILAEGEVDVDAGGTKDNEVDFSLPKEVAILAAGSFGERFSFFTEIGFENEDEVETEISAWLMWDDLFSSFIGENHLNIKAGTVGMQEIALPNNRGHNRITVENYLHEQELDLDGEPGFEMNGFGRRWRYFLGIVDSDRSNSEKDPYAGLAFKLGGLGFNGSGVESEEEALTTSPSGYWRDDSVQFGIFVYRSYIGDDADKFDRIGGDIRLNYKDLQFGGGYIHGEDDSDDTDKDLWFAEAEYFLFPWWVAYCRFEDLAVDGGDDEDQARFIPGMVFLLRANIRATVEGRFYTENEPAKAEGGDTNDDDRVVFNLAWAF